MTTPRLPPEELERLAVLCEQGSGEERSLDALIWTAVDRPEPGDIDRNRAIHDQIVAKMLAGGDDCECPRYTASLDAAMTLAPTGWRVRQMNFSAPCADSRSWHVNLHGGREGRDTFAAEAATPALALTAACLRAHASLSRMGEDR